MSHIPRALATRLARLEAQCVRIASQSILLVRLYQGETRDTALQAAGYSPAAVSGRLVVFLRRGWSRAQEDTAIQSQS
jgi:hypothetical protein